jgi:hypothetical protein
MILNKLFIISNKKIWKKIIKMIKDNIMIHHNSFKYKYFSLSYLKGHNKVLIDEPLGFCVDLPEVCTFFAAICFRNHGIEI